MKMLGALLSERRRRRVARMEMVKLVLKVDMWAALWIKSYILFITLYIISKIIIISSIINVMCFIFII